MQGGQAGRVPDRAPLSVGTRLPHRCPVAAGLPPDRGDPGSRRVQAARRNPSSVVLLRGEWCRDHVQDWRHPHRGCGSPGQHRQLRRRHGARGRTSVQTRVSRQLQGIRRPVQARRDETRACVRLRDGCDGAPALHHQFPDQAALAWQEPTRGHRDRVAVARRGDPLARDPVGSPSRRSAAGWAGCTGRMCVSAWRRPSAGSTASRSSSSSQAELRRTVE